MDDQSFIQCVLRGSVPSGAFLWVLSTALSAGDAARRQILRSTTDLLQQTRTGGFQDSVGLLAPC
jgi:hypothetical protein